MEIENETGLPENFVPYAPPSNVQTVLEYKQSGALPFNVILDNKAVRETGVPKTMANITSQALKFLGFINAYGDQSEEFEKLSGASPEVYREVLANALRKHYDFIFNVLDVNTATREELRKIFDKYHPYQQTDRQVTLLVQLCGIAGLMRNVKPVKMRKETIRKQAAKVSSGNLLDHLDSQNGKSLANGQDHLPTKPVQPDDSVSERSTSMGTPEKHPKLKMLIDDLPESEWSQEEEDLWLNYFHAALAFHVRRKANKPQNQKEAIMGDESHHDLNLIPS